MSDPDSAVSLPPGPLYSGDFADPFVLNVDVGARGSKS